MKNTQFGKGVHFEDVLLAVGGVYLTALSSMYLFWPEAGFPFMVSCLNQVVVLLYVLLVFMVNGSPKFKGDRYRTPRVLMASAIVMVYFVALFRYITYSGTIE